MNTDITVDCCGTIYLLRGVSDAGKEWIEENVTQNEETQYWNGAIVVEHRFIADIIEGARQDGLTITTNFPS